LKQRNFGFGTLAMTMVGFALFGSVYILPAYLAQAQGYNAEQIGNVLAWTGLPGKLVKRQSLVMGFSDTFAVIGVVLVLAALAVLLTRRVKAAGGPAH
jgi:hypothetical protein